MKMKKDRGNPMEFVKMSSSFIKFDAVQQLK